MSTVLTDAEIARAALTVFSPSDAVTAVAIALAESGGNAAAHNNVPPDDSWGLWQINMLGRLGPARLAAFGLRSEAQLVDPLTNARAAAHIKAEQGWGAWSTYSHSSHARFLTRAQVAVAAGGSGQRIGRVLRLAAPLLTGDDVRAVQRLVGAHVDGVYGPETLERVRRWQGLHHLAVDGAFGPASTRTAGWTWTGAA